MIINGIQYHSQAKPENIGPTQAQPEPNLGNPTDGNYQYFSGPIVTNRGFTMHEHMDQFKLINMNGRVYDPVLAQFLSPDPFVANAASTMSYNRYAYCNYNPLKYVDPSGYWIANVYDAVRILLNSPFGGEWSSGGAGGRGDVRPYTSSDQGYLAGVAYNDRHNSWGNTYYGSASASARVYYNLSGGKTNLVPISNCGHILQWDAKPEWFNKFFNHLELRLPTVKPTISFQQGGGNNYSLKWFGSDSYSSGVGKLQGGLHGSSLDNLSYLVLTADFANNIAKTSGYKATVGIWHSLLKFRYYPSGWTGSNQYVWKTFSVTGGVTAFLWGANTTIEYLKYSNGQSGLETSLNIGASTTSLIVAAKVGTPAGIAASVGYEYLKYLWNIIYDYGESVNNLYRNTYQDYWEGTLLDPLYE